MNLKNFINFRDVLPRLSISLFTTPLNWEIKEGETWSIVGKNGSGKSLFAEVLCGRYNLLQGNITYSFLKEGESRYAALRRLIKTVSFKSVYSLADFREMYYQQRFNSADADLSPFISEFINTEELRLLGHLVQALDMEKLMTRRLVQLSSGELRKLLIAKALLENPRMLIFDNPFIGLDTPSREYLDEVFVQLSKSGLQLLFLIPSGNHLPTATSHVLKLDNGTIVGQEPVHLFKAKQEPLAADDLVVDWTHFPSSKPDYETVVRMENLTISYGKHIVAQDINWEIKRGEKWALLGTNGSGKSTLLSYIFADNPQAYSKNLTLFDRKRGTGESIWDIKKHIGFTSSELHLYYRENVDCWKIVSSGFFDAIGLFRKCTEQQEKTVDYLFDLLNINHLKERSFLRVSSGEQRLVLFARSLVKNPELLILDEPFHGLDGENKNRCLQVIASYCRQPDKSLIFVTHHQEEIPDSVEHRLKTKS